MALFPFQTLRQEVSDHETRAARRRSPRDHASIVPLSAHRSRYAQDLGAAQLPTLGGFRVRPETLAGTTTVRA